MNNIQTISAVVTVMWLSIAMAACDQKKSPAEKEIAEAPVQATTPAEPNSQQPAASTHSSAQDTKGNYKATVTISAFGADQVVVLENLPLPKNEKEFCQNRDVMQGNMPEGSKVVSCTFSGKTGNSSFEFKIGEQVVKSTARYDYELM